MSERADGDFVSDMQEAMGRIADYIAGITYDEFLLDTKTQDAIIRNLEIIGEATKNLSEALRAKYVEIPWKNLAGVRDKLIHHYFGVNLEIVWQVATAELPDMIGLLAKIASDPSE